MLRACAEFELAKAETTAAAFGEVSALLQTSKAKLAPEETAALELVGTVASSLEQLCRWIEAKRKGVGDADRLLDAARTSALVAQEVLAKVRYAALRDGADRILKSLLAISSPTQVTAVVKDMAGVPVPPFFIATCDPYDGVERVAQSETPPPSSADGPVAIRVMLTLDGKAWANPQVLHSGTVYDVGLTLTVPLWPTGADKLHLDFVTTLPSDLYRITTFILERTGFDTSSEIKMKGQLQFEGSQSLFSEPALLQLRATFLSSGDEKAKKTATVIGYHKLRARVSNPRETPLLSKYRALDARIVQIVDEFRQMPGVAEQHLTDFVAVLAGIANYMGICAQQALYRTGEHIDESTFQKNVLLHMRQQLGEEVLEAPKQAAGITDVQFRSVTIELKVENKIADRKKMLAAYESQPVQYTSGVGAQLGILCVLDLTEKEAPPAPTQNNLIVLKPKLHGFIDDTAPAPVRIVAVVIDGNLRSPSSYSR